MSKFHFHQNGEGPGGRPIYDVVHVESGKHLGLVAKRITGWTIYFGDRIEMYHPTRKVAAERLLLISGLNPVAWSALPADPFDGVSA